MWNLGSEGYTIIPYVADSSDPDLFEEVKLPFYVASGPDMERKTQADSLQAVPQTPRTKNALEGAGIDPSDWKNIFNHAIEALDDHN